MRVLIVHNRYRSDSPSGENRAVDQEAALLTSAGHEVIRYERDSDEISRLPLLKKATLPGRVLWSREDRRRVASLIRRSAPKIVHVHNTFPLISPSVLGSAVELGIPVVATLHNYRLTCSNGLLFRDGEPCELCLGRSAWPGVVHGCYRGSRMASVPVALGIEAHRFFKTWIRGVSAFVALSEFARHKFIEAGLPAERIFVKPNFVQPPAEIRRGAGSFALFIGRLSAEKGVDLLIDAWSSDLGQLLIVGHGPATAGLQKRAGTHGSSVRFLGSLSHDRTMRLLRDARVLVVPSRSYEGFPLAVAEAYAHAVPIIAPARGVFPEIVQHGSTGLLFEPGDSDSLKERLDVLMSGPESMRMGAMARERYEDRYRPSRNLELLLHIYERVVGRRVA
jgi:glycosyltransferase involved in cell wall biosynthesis